MRLWVLMPFLMLWGAAYAVSLRRAELTLAELELSEAQVEQFDIDSALAKAISVLNNAAALWIDASLDDGSGFRKLRISI
jgi:hypothetical protein